MARVASSRRIDRLPVVVAVDQQRPGCTGHPQVAKHQWVAGCLEYLGPKPRPSSMRRRNSAFLAMPSPPLPHWNREQSDQFCHDRPLVRRHVGLDALLRSAGCARIGAGHIVTQAHTIPHATLDIRLPTAHPRVTVRGL